MKRIISAKLKVDLHYPLPTLKEYVEHLVEILGYGQERAALDATYDLVLFSEPYFNTVGNRGYVLLYAGDNRREFA